MSEIDLVIKIRDGAQIIADACAEYLEKQTPKEETPALKEEFDKLPWKEGQGPKGPYESVKDDGNPLFRHLQNILKQNKGRFSEKTWAHYYWVGTQDESMIFRRKKGK